MQTSAQSHLSSTKRRWICAVGALIGGVLGPVLFWIRAGRATSALYGHDKLGFTKSPARFGVLLQSLGAANGQLAFTIVAALATLLLMPRFVRWLDVRAGLPPRAYYGRAALAGVAFGAVATQITATLLVIIATCWGIASAYGAVDGSTAWLGPLLGAAIFAPLFGAFMPFFFLPYIGCAGVAFGVVIGAAVRGIRGAPSRTDPDSWSAGGASAPQEGP